MQYLTVKAQSENSGTKGCLQFNNFIQETLLLLQKNHKQLTDKIQKETET